MWPSASSSRLQLSFPFFLWRLVSVSLLQIAELAGYSHLELLFLDCDKWATSQRCHLLDFRDTIWLCPKLHLFFPWLVKALPISCYCMYSRSISVNGISPGSSFVNCEGQRSLSILHSNHLVFCQEISCHLLENPTFSLKFLLLNVKYFLLWELWGLMGLF